MRNRILQRLEDKKRNNISINVQYNPLPENDFYYETPTFKSGLQASQSISEIE